MTQNARIRRNMRRFIKRHGGAYTRRGRLKSDWLADTSKVSIASLITNPCYRCTLKECRIYEKVTRTPTCERHLINSGLSFRCPYFVRGMCAYTSSSNECALDISGIDKTEHYELLCRLEVFW